MSHLHHFPRASGKRASTVERVRVLLGDGERVVEVGHAGTFELSLDEGGEVQRRRLELHEPIRKALTDER